MQDYGDPHGFPPFVGEGAWPDSVMRTIAVLLLILVVMICYVSHRAGRRLERERLETAALKAPEIIFFAIRRQIDISLMATGERAFGPVRNLIETVDAYLGAVLKLSDGPNSLSVTINKLKKALATDKKKVLVEPEHGGHGHGGAHSIGHGGGSTVIIASGPAAPPLAGPTALGASASVSSGVAAAAAVGPGGGVQVVEPARIYEIPAHGPAPPAPKPVEKEVELTARERAQFLREALEQLSDYWQKERVEGELRAAQKALTITAPIGGDKPPPQAARPRQPGPPPPANPVAKAAREANRGFPLFRL
jgi:hypothetical protein